MERIPAHSLFPIFLLLFLVPGDAVAQGKSHSMKEEEKGGFTASFEDPDTIVPRSILENATSEIDGLHKLVPVFEVEDRPLREVLNLLSRFSGLNYAVAAEVPECRVSAWMSKVRVKEILDVMLPMYGLAWKPDEDLNLVRIVPGDGKPVEDICDSAKFLEPSKLLQYEPLREKLSQILPVFEVDNRAVREYFYLVSHFAEGVSFILCPGIPEDPIFIGFTNKTCGEFVVDLMVMCDLVWKPVPGTSAMIVAPREGKNRPVLRDSAAESSPAEVPPDTQDVSEIVPELNTVIETFEVKDRPLCEVFNELARESGLNFIGLGIHPDPDVTVTFQHKTVEEILNTLSPRYGFRWDVFDDSQSILIGGYHKGPPRVIPAN